MRGEEINLYLEVFFKLLECYLDWIWFLLCLEFVGHFSGTSLPFYLIFPQSVIKIVNHACKLAPASTPINNRKINHFGKFK